MEKLTLKQADPQAFVVTRDGYIDSSYLEALERAEKTEAIKYAGKQAMSVLGRSMAFTGGAVLTGLSRMYNEVQGTSVQYR